MEPDDLYRCLELRAGASIEDVKKAYRRLALLYHPDKPNTGDRQKFEKIKDAYTFLSDPKNKAFYDATLNNGPEYDAMFNSLFNSLFDMLKTRLDAKKKKPKQATSPVKVKLKVTLDEIYRGDIKKVVLRVRRGESWGKETFYIDLTQYQQGVFTFKDQGDEAYGVKSDMVIQLDIQPHETVKRDTVISENDLYMEKSFTLYEYYHGIDRRISFLAGEAIHVVKEGKLSMSEDFYTYTYVVKEHGLPYIDPETKDVKYGDLYIYFRLSLPESLPNNILESAFKSSVYDNNEGERRV